MIKPFKEVYQCDSITLNLTNNCNLDCVYCFEHSKSKDYMTPETGITIIDNAYRELDGDSEFMVNFFGGEPFLNWNTMKAIIDHCNEKKYKILYGVTTNLTILTDEMIRYIDNNNIHLLVSADGLPFIHNRNRCNSWTKVANNINRLIQEGLGIFIEIRMTIMPKDVDMAILGVRRFVEMGLDNICPCPVTDVEWDKHNIEDLHNFYYDLLRYYCTLLNDDTSNRNFCIKNTDEILVNVMEPEVHTPYMCPIGKNTWCAFDTNGDIYPCHQLPTQKDKLSQKIGNIYTGVDDSKITDGKNIAKYSKPECKTCIGMSVCASGCPEENLRQTGDMNIPSDGYCAVQKELVSAVKEFQDKIINASNVRNRLLNRLKENLKIKEYIDTVLATTNPADRLNLSIRLMHLQEMINALGEENIFPSFGDYFENKIIEYGAKAIATQKDN